MAERIAGAASVDRDFAYTSGILHDVGRVALATLRPDSYATLLKNISVGSGELLNFERKTFGLDHCEAGSHLAVAWHLPQEVTAVIAHHHDPLTHAQDAPELIRLSCRLAHALGFTTSPHRPSLDANAVLCDFPEAMRARVCLPGDLVREIEQELKVIEAA